MIYTQYVTYFLMGYIIGNRPHANGYRWIIVWIAASAVKIAVQCISISQRGEGTALLLEDRIFTLFQAVAVYIIFMQYFSTCKINSVFRSISRCSFGIYLIHPLFINLLYKWINITPTNFLEIGVAVPVLWATVFMISWLMAWVMIKMPLLKRIL